MSELPAEVQHWTGSFRPTGPTWLRERQRAALDDFAATGFPTRRHEAWKHTSVRELTSIPFRAAGPGASPSSLPDIPAGEPVLVTVDGQHRPELSHRGSLPEGVVLTGLQQALRTDPHRVRAHLGRSLSWQDRAFVALNTAYLGDGALLWVPRGVHLDHPIHLVHDAATAERASHLRTLVVAEPGSRVAVVQHWVGGWGRVFSNAVTELFVGRGAHVDHLELQQEGPEAFHVATVAAEVAGRLGSWSVATGGRLGRTELDVRLTDPGAEADLRGLSLGRGEQHLDHTLVVDHLAPHGRSDQVFRAILDQRARGVFNGLVRVREGAAGTSAGQRSQTLLLSPQAGMHARPQLQIDHDDVQCAHGATVGQLDDEALFYLRSRGLGAVEARRLLTGAFTRAVVHELPEGPLRDRAERVVDDWLAGLGAT